MNSDSIKEADKKQSADKNAADKKKTKGKEEDKSQQDKKNVMDEKDVKLKEEQKSLLDLSFKDKLTAPQLIPVIRNRDTIDQLEKTHFQVRMKIIEARQLQGNNIKPVVRVTLLNQMKQTRVKKATSCPYWGETFFYNFHTPASELFDEVIEFEVFNSKKLMSDALIGSFKCDVGFIYDENKHCLLNKWLLLSDPDDNMSGAKGYLKISAVILGPGDEAPSFKSDTQDESQDIESNLLRPAGIQLRPATFSLKLYKAEDIPRMDTAFFEGVKNFLGAGEEQKQLVDPYFVFSFAGKEVRSKIMCNSDHPEWNQILSLGIQFPSMCERLKFVMMDWDRLTEDDTIGTSFLPLSTVSSTADTGFLPTFGPTFVNFYGSTREYSDLPDELDDLNKGKGEGVAYRGRALVELTTELGQLPEDPVDDINNDDILRVQKYMRRRKYRLHAAFLSATMVSAVDAPVEFEVSIGNYGNKLDENTAPSASTTQPTNAVFDGCHYYFLPWANTKPCVVVDCHWEDISFRLETLNLLLYIINRLKTNIEKCKTGLKAKLAPTDLAHLFVSMLNQLLEDCRNPLPSPQSGYHNPNELDVMLKNHRTHVMETIINQAQQLRDGATDVSEAMNTVENLLEMLKGLAIEPQNSMPDVIIWMISGVRRIAYFRMPANELLFSKSSLYMGQNCGRTLAVELQYPGEDNDKKDEIPAVVRAKFWLGLKDHEAEWHRMQSEGEMAVFAETYENQVNILGKWTTKGPTMTRPKWSDSLGKVQTPKDKFVPPSGWKWEGDWYISPELSMLLEKDEGYKTFLEDVYENESRTLGGGWAPATRAWTDVKSDQIPGKNEIKLKEGWKWDDDWKIDLGRAVDENGYEYCVDAIVGGYGAVQKMYHRCRRRRWVRPRTLVVDTKKKKQKEKVVEEIAEGWEYAPLFNMKFHATKRTMDLVRRRRWHRKMIAEDPCSECFFSLQTEVDGKEGSSVTAPRMFLQFKKVFKYQLRTYMYQARDLLAADDTGLSDPFARVSFLTQSMVTEKIKKSLCPTWDQSLIFEEIEIHGDPKNIERQPPYIIIEVFDYDTFGKPEFLGRTKAQPMVKLNSDDSRLPILQWFKIMRGKQQGGELLAAFELFLCDGKELPFFPPKRGNLFVVPNGIRPVMQRTAIEVLCWGVRNMKKFQLSSVNSPSVELECGGNVAESSVIKDTEKNPNFKDPILFFDVMLPKEELYMPPMNIKIRDHRQFGRKPTVGIHCIRNLEPFKCEALFPADKEEEDETAIPVSVPEEHIIEMPTEKERKSLLKKHKKYRFPKLGLSKFVPAASARKREEKGLVVPDEIDWWSKYYASTGENDKCRKYLEKGMDKIKIYDIPLENVEGFGEFKDFCSTFDLERGKDDDDDDDVAVGQFKGTFKVYTLPPDPSEPMPKRVLSNLPTPDPEECLIRVYVIRGVELQPNDANGLADPYVEIQLGKKKVNSRDDYIPNTTNPVFGKMFEVSTIMPVHKDLTIKIKDYDLISSDDVIGETKIDLENRYLTKFKACCGIPKTYCIAGTNEWRGSSRPIELLEEYCKTQHMSGPIFYGLNSVTVDNKVYNLEDFETKKPTDSNLGPPNERLALHVLNKFPVVQEHVETRPLYNPLQPGIEQGRLQMWVDIFPTSLGPPGPPFNIEPRKGKGYVLRIVVYNTVDVILEDESITGELMSDIYVKGWMAAYEETQETDVHYRSLDGEGNFNWRFVFPFDYLPAEQVMVVKRKEHFWSLDETEQRVVPAVTMQIWDNDKFSADDFLGTVDFNLNAIPKPAKTANKCNLNILPEVGLSSGKCHLLSLFEQKRIRGFWPCYSDEDGERTLTGKLELEMELLTKEEAELRPAGTAREDPNMNPKLEEPKRPATSFLWFTSPWKSLKYIIWKRYKWYFISFVLLTLLVLLVLIFIYSFPLGHRMVSMVPSI